MVYRNSEVLEPFFCKHVNVFEHPNQFSLCLDNQENVQKYESVHLLWTFSRFVVQFSPCLGNPELLEMFQYKTTIVFFILAHNEGFISDQSRETACTITTSSFRNCPQTFSRLYRNRKFLTLAIVFTLSYWNTVCFAWYFLQWIRDFFLCVSNHVGLRC